MKTLNNTRPVTVLMTAILLSGAFTACKKKKEVVATPPPTGEVEITVFCSGPEYFTNDKAFRQNAVGESMDQMTAKNKALSAARGLLAADISTQVKRVIDNYVNSREMNNREEVAERYENLSREVVDQQLKGVKTICERQVRVGGNGNYKTYIAIELSAHVAGQLVARNPQPAGGARTGLDEVTRHAQRIARG